MIHPSVTDTADVNEFGAVRIPEEILRKLGAGVGDLISFVKDATGLTKPLRIPTMQFATD